MSWLRDILLTLAVGALVIAGVDRSLRAMTAALLLATAAYAIHRRFVAFWWLGCALLAWAFVESLRDAFRGPGTPLAIMSTLLGMLLAALLLSVWIRQRHYFVTRSTPKA
jgi:hypothetical protein